MKSWEKAKQASVISAKPRTSDGKFLVAGRGLLENGEKLFSPDLKARIPQYTINNKKN